MDYEEKERIYQENLNTSMNCRMQIKAVEKVIKELEKLSNTLGIEAFETEYPQLLVLKDWLQLRLDDLKADIVRRDTHKNHLERAKNIYERAKNNS